MTTVHAPISVVGAAKVAIDAGAGALPNVPHYLLEEWFSRCLVDSIVFRHLSPAAFCKRNVLTVNLTVNRNDDLR